MKKTIKTVLVFTLGMFLATTSLSAMGYINWKGTPQVESTMVNLDKIENLIETLKLNKSVDTKDLETQLEEYVQMFKDQEKLLDERDVIIEQARELVKERDTIILELTHELEQLELDNEQAYNDVKMINERVLELLKGNE